MLFNQLCSISFCSFCVDEGKDREIINMKEKRELLFVVKNHNSDKCLPLFSIFSKYRLRYKKNSVLLHR